MRAARFVLLALLPSAALGQQVELRVLEEATRVPVVGAIVRLLGDRGIVAQGLTSESGRIALAAPRAGSYRLKVDRIGWSGMITEPFPLAAGESYRREILMTSNRTALPTLEVRGRSRCSREGQGGPLAAALWDEVGKALTANVMTQRQAAIHLHVRGFIRELDRARRPLRQWVVASTLTQGQPFASLRPADLAAIGFVQEESHDSVTYAAPDAALILSDEFVATHCFKAIPGDSSLVGLAFEPTAGRKVPDVRGTLWVDRATSELRFLEYDYTGLPGILARADLGGRVEFRRIPSGEWIVSYWFVRTPALEALEVRGAGNVLRSAARLTGYLELGGRAEIAADSLGSVDRALLMGIVFDSIAGAGLAGAVVRVRGYPDSIVTDGTGQFQLAVQASGDQVVVVSHSKETLIHGGARRPALLSLGDTTRVEFAVASLGALVRMLCGKMPRGRSGIVGMAWEGNGKLADGLGVRISWIASSGGVRVENRSIERDGLFSFCDLPPDRTLPIQLIDRMRAFREVPVKLEWGEFRFVELRPPL